MQLKRKTSGFILLFLVLGILLAGTATAAGQSASSGTDSGKWTEKKGYYYYLNEKGKKVKGLQNINGRYYLFDQKGRQQYGWRVIKGKYFFFYQKNGARGYQVRSGEINGIKLQKSGRAKVTTLNKWKLQLMAAYQLELDKLVKPSMSKMDKLKAAFNFAKHKKEDSFGTLQRAKYGDNWYLHYAEFFLNNDRADCYTRGCGLAFLANAIGCKNVKCCANWGHGFCEINNKVFDPSFAKPYSDTRFPYFNGSYKVYSAWAGYPYKVLI